MKKSLLLAFCILSLSATAGKKFVVVRPDSAGIVVADSTALESKDSTWTLSGNTLLPGYTIERAETFSGPKVVTFEACTFAANKHNNIVSSKVNSYTEAGLTFKVQEFYGMFGGALVTEQSEVSKWQDEHPGTASSNKVITTDATLPAAAEGSHKYVLMRYDTYVSKTKKGEQPAFTFDGDESHEMVSVMVNNTADVWQNCKIGYYSKPAFQDGDYYEVVFTGYDAAGNVTGSVTVPLADYRNGKTYLCNEWTKVSLSGLGKVHKVVLTAQSSDTFNSYFSGAFGVCLDNISFK
ncbi:MAG: DUF4465 domain-containing protein [Prevotella sp.]|nr:DUF4465 domain-containing protein [Prevotella sp.]